MTPIQDALAHLGDVEAFLERATEAGAIPVAGDANVTREAFLSSLECVGKAYVRVRDARLVLRGLLAGDTGLQGEDMVVLLKRRPDGLWQARVLCFEDDVLVAEGVGYGPRDTAAEAKARQHLLRVTHTQPHQPGPGGLAS